MKIAPASGQPSVVGGGRTMLVAPAKVGIVCEKFNRQHRSFLSLFRSSRRTIPRLTAFRPPRPSAVSQTILLRLVTWRTVQEAGGRRHLIFQKRSKKSSQQGEPIHMLLAEAVSVKLSYEKTVVNGSYPRFCPYAFASLCTYV